MTLCTRLVMTFELDGIKVSILIYIPLNDKIRRFSLILIRAKFLLVFLGERRWIGALSPISATKNVLR